MEHHFTWFEWLFGFVNPHNVHVFSALLVAVIIVACAAIYRASLKPVEQEIIPAPGFTLKNAFQTSVESVLTLMEGILGHDARKHFPIIGAVFIYIFLNNLLGSIPGFVPATGNVNTNFACSIMVFVYYNYVGIKEQGLKNYLKHFMGPVLWIAPLLLVIELISHVVRPITLAVRLFGNLTGDHIVLGEFSKLVPLLVPVVFMAFGVFVSFIQAFVFTLLSTVYIGMAAAHEEH